MNSIADFRVSEVALTTRDAHTITAAIAEDGHLEVRSWGLDLTPRGNERGAEGSRVAIVALARRDGGSPKLAGRYLTAMRDRDGRLRLDLWHVPLDGTVRHVTHFTDDQGRDDEEVKAGLTMIGVAFDSGGGSDGVVELVVRYTGGHVEAQEWAVNIATDKAPARISRFPPPLRMGKAKRIAAPATESLGDAFTAFENEDGNLVTSTFEFTFGSGPFNLRQRRQSNLASGHLSGRGLWWPQGG